MKEFSCIEQFFETNPPIIPNVMVNIDGNLRCGGEGTVYEASTGIFSDEPSYSFSSEDDTHAEVKIASCGYEVIENFEFFKTSAAVRQITAFRNTSDHSAPLMHLTSARFSFPWRGGILDWNDPRRFRIHYSTYSNGSEGQWVEKSFADLGLFPVYTTDFDFQTRRPVLLRSEGSWSTGRYYPLLIVEDRETGVAYYIEHEGGVTWEITLTVNDGRLYLEANSANNTHDLWYRELAPDETYTTTPAILGKVEGGFEEAVAELIRAKRESSLVHWKNGVIPVCYNVYMGGLFGSPNDRELPPLIEAAAKDGCEVFCIDAGWFRPEVNNSGSCFLGDYVPDDKRFGKYGLAGILKLIADHGMVPGLWFEFEAVDENIGAVVSETAVIRRNGHIVSPGRAIYDLCDPAVRKKLLESVDRVYRMGLRYLKNDHNLGTGTGYGKSGECFGEEARKRAEALLSFIDELRLRYPDLIIESCASGGMRTDHGTLRHHFLESTSDQEYYFNYPAIVVGVGATMEPEKAANWDYPYALTKAEHRVFNSDPQILQNLIARYADGEATIFNMINGFMGVMYLSGRLEYADAKNEALIREGITLYKSHRGEIIRSVPVFPTGMPAMGQPGYVTYGLKTDDVILLAVWRMMTRDENFSFDLSRYGAKSVEQIYPSADLSSRFVFAQSTGRMTVEMKGAKNMGRLYLVKLK